MRFGVKIVQKFYVMHGQVVLSVLYYFPSFFSLVYIRCPCKVFLNSPFTFLSLNLGSHWHTIFFLISKCYLYAEQKNKNKENGT